MKKLEKTLKLIGLAFLLALASFGVGILGGVPVQPIRKKEDTIEVVIQLDHTEKLDLGSTEVLQIKE